MRKNQKSLLTAGLSGQQNRIIVIFGKKGRGKTTLISRGFLPDLLKSRLLIFDPHREYTDKRILRADKLEELHEFLIDNYTGGPWAIVWTPERASQIEYFLQICYNMRDVWIIFEEVNMRGLGNIREPSPTFIDIVNFGRNRNISLICTAKRPAQVNRELTAAADVIISFRQDEPNDIDYLKEYCGRDIEDRVSGLSGHEWSIIYPVETEKKA